MEPDASIETLSMVRIAVVPVGDVPHLLLREYYSMFEKLEKISLSAISSFYTEHQKSPFAHQPWDSGALRFKFILGGCPPSPWEDFQSNRKTLGLIGICHCPSSPNLDSSMDLFESTCRSFPSSLVQRCFAFSPGDSQLEDAEEKGEKLRIFPPSDKHSQEVHLQTMMHEIGASLLMEFERWVLKAESVGTILKTPLDSQASLSSEEVIKSKKRRLGRAQKTIGDYCLLAGSPVDANAHYSTALELARLTGDLFWYAGALEGTVCALLIDQSEKTDSMLEDEVRYRYNSAISHYRKSFIQESTQRVSPLSFELEATLRVARFFFRRGVVKDVVDMLTSAADGGKSLIDASDRLILYVEVARLFGSIGYHRKAAFFSRQVAQLYLQQDHRMAAISAMQVLTLTTKAYHIQSKTPHSQSNETELWHSDNGKVNHQSIVSLFESQWSSLQMVVLREILLSAIRAGDPLTTWSAAARLLRSYYPLITPSGQSALATALSNASDRLPPGTHCADTALPFVRLCSFPSHSSDIIKRTPGRGDWWGGSAPSGPFIYTPFRKGETSESSKQEVVWVVGEPVQVLVELANPCAFELKVESICLLSRQHNLDAFPISVSLPPSSSKVVSLSGIPTSSGSISLPGCVVRCFGVVTEHVFRDVENLLLGAAQGLVLSDPFRSCGSSKIKNVAVPSISVVAALPLVVSHIEGGDGAIVLYEGEIRDVHITLANAGSVAVHEAHMSLSGKNQDSVVSLPQEALNCCLPLQPGAEVTLPITLKAWQLSVLDTDKHSSGRQSQLKDANSPSLVIHYGGPSTSNGRRLVVPLHICVLQGLSFVKGRMLAMEIPGRVGESDPLSESEKGSWGMRFMELEMSNPTDVVFEVTVAVEDDQSFPKTRIDRDHSSRVLIPLNHFKLPVLDGYTKAELGGSIKTLISKIKVRWHSGRNSSGELNIREAIQSALRASVMDVLLPDPLSFGFRLVEKASVVAHELSRMEVMVRNNTKEAIRLRLSIACRDVAGENCVEGEDATVLWGGSLNGMPVEVPPLTETSHTFALYFRVPGEYTLLAAAVIDHPTDVLATRARATSPNDPIYCRGPPFHLLVLSHLHL